MQRYHQLISNSTRFAQIRVRDLIDSSLLNGSYLAHKEEEFSVYDAVEQMRSILKG
jgi:hypothetical protein